SDWFRLAEAEKKDLSGPLLVLLAATGTAFLLIWALLQFEAASAFLLGAIGALAVGLFSFVVRAEKENWAALIQAVRLAAGAVFALGVGIVSFVYLRPVAVEAVLGLALGFCVIDLALEVLHDSLSGTLRQRIDAAREGVSWLSALALPVVAGIAVSVSSADSF